MKLVGEMVKGTPSDKAGCTSASRLTASTGTAAAGPVFQFSAKLAKSNMC